MLSAPHPSLSHALKSVSLLPADSSLATHRLMTPSAAGGPESTVMFVPSPSSSCRIRWVLNLSSNTHTLRIPPSSDTGQLPLTSFSSTEPSELLTATGGDAILGGWLDGLSDEPEGGEMDSKRGCEYDESGFEMLNSASRATHTFGSASEQKLQWRVEVKRPEAESAWQHTARA